MIHYKVYQSKRNDTTKGKFYARAVATETYDLDQLAEHMANHNTPFSKGAIKGVLIDMVSCIKELVLDGKQVKIDDLALFKVAIRSTPATTAAEWAVDKNVGSLKLNARATGVLRPSEFRSEAKLGEMQPYEIED